MKQTIKTINQATQQVPYYSRLLDVFEGNLIQYVAASLSTELSPESYRVASTRIPSINLLRRIVKKLSKVYTAEPKRTTLDLKDQEQINQIVKSANLQNVMSNAEDLLNLQKCCALEPYLVNGEFAVRVLGPQEFMVLGQDSQNPNRVTTFVKFMGSRSKAESEQSKTRTAQVYWLYTDSQFIVVDSEGEVMEVRDNPYGLIPFVYINSSSNYLMPSPDNDSFANSILIPKLLSDLNYATQFQSHSIMYSIDAEIQNKLSGAPDAMWNLSSRDGEGKSPQVGVLSPSVDTDKVLSLITFTVAQWLESRGIKAGSVGSLQASNMASGVSKIIDEADVAQVVQENRLILVDAEQRLWKLIGVMHNMLLGTEQLNATLGFSEPLDVSISFAIQQPIVDPAELRNELKFKLDNGLISYARALKQANPDLSDDELLKLKAEIEAENNSPEPK